MGSLSSQHNPSSVERSLRILIVDNEPAIADTLSIILKNRRHDVRTAYSGEQAVEIAAAFLPDAVVTDVVMGATSGIELAIHLAKTQPACAVLLISGNQATQELMQRAEAQGHSFRLLAKPAHPCEILSILENRA